MATAADEAADDEEEPCFLPPFANAENKALDAHIRVSILHASSGPITWAVLLLINLAGLLQTVEKHLDEIDLTLEENSGRINVMDEHLKNVQQEITYTESRVSLLFSSCARGD